MEWMQQHRGLLIVEGILFILLGILAVVLPGISTLSVDIFLGWLLIFGGAIQLYRTMKGGYHAPGFAWSILSGLLYLIFGILLIAFPIAGIFSLTILLTFFFLAEGLTKIILGFQWRPLRRWGWLIVNGIISLIMAWIIWDGWPGTAFWVLGLLVGINMIFFGMSLLFLAFGTPRLDSKP